jgi:hypothetical protein
MTTRVLVYPAGTEIGLEVLRGLSGRHDLEVVGASDPASHAPSVFREFAAAPFVGAPGWFEALQCLVRELRIDVVYPTHDEAIYELAGRDGELGALIAGSPPETCRVCRFKSATYALLAGELPVPRRFDVGAVDRFPVFVKPDRGQGSRGALRVDDAAQLGALPLAGQLVLEYLPGEEYTVDCFSDRDAGLLFARARRRTRVNAGISVRTQGVDLPDAERFAARIASRLRLHGAWFFQLKAAADGQLRLLEVAPRVAGAMAYYRVQGVNFPLLTVYEAQRRPVTVRPQLVPDLVLDRALANRYERVPAYDRVYVDLDDTLLVRGRLNTLLVRFVFQCTDRGIPVLLLTRHANDIQATLRRHRLAGVFDEVLHLRDGEPKSGAIRGESPIFIDDSFRERAEVEDRLGIRTFDPSALELLIDDRN